MNKREKEVLQTQLDKEKAVLEALKKQYARSLRDIEQKTKVLMFDIQQLDEALNTDGLDDRSKEVLESRKQSKIYQKQRQDALKKQVAAITEKLHSDEYSTIEQYLKECYTDSYVGTMYDIAGQGIPVITPIDQVAVMRAVTLDSKISKGLYTALGVDTNALKIAISAEISRGIATGLSYAQIAKNLDGVAQTKYSNAMRIVRTEGHRVQNASTYDAQQAAKAKGCDVLKQWDSTLDGKTRPVHRELDGQIREVEEYFEAAGKKAKYPGDFGDPAEDCNCRCTTLTRARWALGEAELQTLQDRARFFGLDKSESFEDYKKKYLKAAKAIENSENGNIMTLDRNADVSYIANTYGNSHASSIKATLDNAPPEVVRVWNKYQGDFKTVNASYSGNTANYSPASGAVTLDIAKAAKGNSYQTPYQVLYHEYGHMTDYLAAKKMGHGNYVAFTEIYGGLDANKQAIFVARGQGGLLGNTAKDELKNLIKAIKKDHGVRTKGEAANILIQEIKGNYSLIDRSDVSDMLEGAGIGVPYPLGVGHGKSYWKNRDNGKEIFAEILSAEIASPGSLSCIQKYFPETYKVFRDILEVIK